MYSTYCTSKFRRFAFSVIGAYDRFGDNEVEGSTQKES